MIVKMSRWPETMRAKTGERGGWESGLLRRGSRRRAGGTAPPSAAGEGERRRPYLSPPAFLSCLLLKASLAVSKRRRISGFDVSRWSLAQVA